MRTQVRILHLMQEIPGTVIDRVYFDMLQPFAGINIILIEGKYI